MECGAFMPRRVLFPSLKHVKKRFIPEFRHTVRELFGKCAHCPKQIGV